MSPPRAPLAPRAALLAAAALLLALCLGLSLARAATEYTLTLVRAPSGQGTVTSSPAGIECGETCTKSFPEATTLTLTASPQPGSLFKGWSGCDAEPAGKCELTLTESRAVGATFATAPRIASETWSAHDTAAVLGGEVDPEAEPTEYRIQYVTEAHYQTEGFANPGEALAAPATLPASSAPIKVSAPLSGLAPSSAYRFRLLAHNSLGDAAGEALPFATLEPEHLFGPCPANEAFRTGPSANLPDCRAYEQASPIDKNGGNIGGTVALVKASTSGDGITFESQAGIPGGEGSQSFPTYMASREGGSWVSRGLLPPASAGEIGEVLGWTPDFDWVFGVAAQAGAEAALLARPRQGGPLAEVAPYDLSSNHRISGFSADDSTVVFHANGVLPVKAGDPKPAADRNAYAWDSEGEELSLAGVLPNGSVPTEGTAVPGGYASDMHAVAEDGSALFINRNTRGLYLRQHPTAKETAAKDGEGNCIPDPVLACTLAVSKSRRSVPDPGGPFEPVFRGASTDGSVAFFTSKEELTDDAKTIGSPNVIGRAEVPAGEEPASNIEGAHVAGPNASALDANASHLYWVNTEAGMIGRVKLNGEDEEPECIVLPQVEVEAGVFLPPNPAGITIGVGTDSNHLYWTSPADGAAGHGVIGRADISGSCASAQLSAQPEFIKGASNPLGIDTEGTHLYWANRGSFSVGRATIDGSSEVAPEWFKGTSLSRAMDVAADAAHDYLFIGRGFGGEIARVNLTNPASEAIGLPIAAAEAKHIDTDGSHIYWTYAINGSQKTENIARSNLDGKNAEHDFIPAEAPAGIAVGTGADSGHLYWGARPSSRGEDLYRFDAEAGELEDLALPAKAVHGAEVQGVLGTSDDGTSAYFVANGAFDGASDGTCRNVSEGYLGSCNVYLWHEGDPISFITRLDAKSDASDWSTGPPSKTARVSADGRTVIFESARRLTAYENEGNLEVYRWQVGDSGPSCISCDPSGAPPTGPARFGSLQHPTTFLGAEIQMNLLSRNLSSDGNRVFFETSDALVTGDTNGDVGCPGWGSNTQAISIGACQDAYMWEAKGTGSCESDAQDRGCVYLLSTGTSGQASFFVDADPSGDNAFIYTDSRLVGQDEDDLIDVYDARVEGGLSSQRKPESATCTGEACQGAPLPLPEIQAPGSAGFSGSGNQTPRRPHKKHRRQKHAKHQRHHKHGQAKKRRQRAAEQNRRTDR